MRAALAATVMVLLIVIAIFCACTQPGANPPLEAGGWNLQRLRLENQMLQGEATGSALSILS